MAEVVKEGEQEREPRLAFCWEGVESLRGGNSRENAAALRLAGWLARGVRVDVGMAMPTDVGAELGLAILRVGADGLVPWARRCEAYSRISLVSLPARPDCPDCP